jgi:hypothetical protein
MTDQAPEPIDVRNNPESRAADSAASSPVARASDGGAPPRDAPSAGDLPTPTEGGVAEGNPVAGVTISEADQQDAVSGDTGPDERGGRGNAGHA